MLDGNGFEMLSDEEIYRYAAGGVMGIFFNRVIPAKGYMEFTVYDEEGYQIPILKQDGLIYHNRIVAMNCDPQFEYATKDSLVDFVSGIQEILKFTKGTKNTGFISLYIFGAEQEKLDVPIERIRWKIASGMIKMTSDLPPYKVKRS